MPAIEQNQEMKSASTSEAWMKDEHNDLAYTQRDRQERTQRPAKNAPDLITSCRRLLMLSVVFLAFFCTILVAVRCTVKRKQAGRRTARSDLERPVCSKQDTAPRITQRLNIQKPASVVNTSAYGPADWSDFTAEPKGQAKSTLQHHHSSASCLRIINSR